MASTTTASSARRSGEAGREESSRSRRAWSTRVASGSASLCSAARRAARACSDAVRNTFTSASGTTVVPMSRPSTTIPPLPIARAAAATSRARTSGTADTRGHRRGDAVGPDRPCHVHPVDPDRRRAPGRCPRPARACSPAPRRHRRRGRRPRARASTRSVPGTWSRCPGSAGRAHWRPRARRTTSPRRTDRRRRRRRRSDLPWQRRPPCSSGLATPRAGCYQPTAVRVLAPRSPLASRTGARPGPPVRCGPTIRRRRGQRPSAATESGRTASSTRPTG